MTPWVYKTHGLRQDVDADRRPRPGRARLRARHQGGRRRAALLFLGTELGLWISVDGGAHWAEFKGGDFPERGGARPAGPAARPRSRARHARPRASGSSTTSDAAPRADAGARWRARRPSSPGGPVQQRMPAQGGWVEGDAAFVGQNPPAGAVDHLLPARAAPLRARSSSRCSTPRASWSTRSTPRTRRGINRVTWSMQVKPPRVPAGRPDRLQRDAGAARPARHATPLRLTQGTRDARDATRHRPRPARPLQRGGSQGAVRGGHDGAHALFGDDEHRHRSASTARAAPARGAHRRRCRPGDALVAKLRSVAKQLEELKKKIVATKEGGAITGEERIREHLDTSTAR